MGAVIIAARYVPRPSDDSVWMFWAPPRAREPVLDLVGGNFPFKPTWARQQFHYNDQGNVWLWWQPPRSRETVLDLVGGNFPFKAAWRRLEQHYEPAPWRFQSQPVPQAFNLTVAAPFTANWQRWEGYYNDQGNSWNWAVPPRQRENVLDLVGGNFPFKPIWQTQQFRYNDAGNEWLWWQPPRSRETVLDLVGGNFPFKPTFWKSNYRDDGNDWRSAPIGVPLAIRLDPSAQPAPFTPQWQTQQFRYNDAGNEWQFWTPSRARETVLDKVGGGFPFTPRFWRANYNDQGNLWEWQTPSRQRNRVLDIVFVTPLTPSFRALEVFYEPMPWQYKVKPVSIPLLASAVVIPPLSGYLAATEPPDRARFVVAQAPTDPGDLHYGWPHVIVRRRL